MGRHNFIERSRAVNFQCKILECNPIEHFNPAASDTHEFEYRDKSELKTFRFISDKKGCLALNVFQSKFPNNLSRNFIETWMQELTPVLWELCEFEY